MRSRSTAPCKAAGVIERPWIDDGNGHRHRGLRLTTDLPPNFALNQALSPFAYAALDLLDQEDPAYAHDVVSVLESTLDDPRQVLSAQENKARGEAVAAMKADGLEYDQRMALLEDVSYPKPLAELLDAMFVTYRQTNPWVADLTLSPKSVVRDMHERAMSFAEYVAYYQLDRTEGVLLRYLADAYRALRQTVPEDARTEELWELIEWLGDLVRRHRLQPARRVGAPVEPARRARRRCTRVRSTTTPPSPSPPTRGCSARSCAAPCSAGSSSPPASSTAGWRSWATSTPTTSRGPPTAGGRRWTRSTTTTTRSSRAPPPAGRACSR